MTQDHGTALLPEIVPNEQEKANGSLNPDSFLDAVNALKEHGCLIMRNCFDQERLKEIHSRSNLMYDKYIEQDIKRAKERAVIPLPLATITNTPKIYANEFAFPVINEIIDHNSIVRSFYLLVSPAGGQDQDIHRDHPLLFSDACMPDIIHELPPFDIRMFVPLVDLTPENGPPRVWPKTHLLTEAEETLITETSGYVDPYMQIGDCLLIDGRLMHKGVENKSNQTRPVIYFAYSQPWFRDTTNFYRANNPEMTEEEFNKVPDQYKSLLKHYFGESRSSYLI